MTRLNSIFLFAHLLLISTLSFSQDEGVEKEIIIIERTIDDKGNVISQNTKRHNGKYTEEELQDLLKDHTGAPHIRSYDLEGLGFEDNLNDLFRSGRHHPTMGIKLAFENGQATVDEVHDHSGAFDADIRVGDVLISVDRLPISTIDEVKEILNTKSSDDVIQVLIFRDGQEIEKKVSLRNTDDRLFSFEFPDGGRFKGLGGEGFDLSFDIDSLFGKFFDSGSVFENFGDLRESPQTKGNSRLNKSTQRASLGVFIDDVGSQVVIAEVLPDSPASKYGLLKNDIILSVDSNIVTSFREVSAYMNTKRIGDSILLELERDGSVLSKDIILD